MKVRPTESLGARGPNAVAQGVTALERARAKDPASTEVEIEDVSFVSGQTTVISHGLGRAWRSWVIVRPRDAGYSTVYEGIHTEDEKRRVLKLQCGASFVANVRIR